MIQGCGWVCEWVAISVKCVSLLTCAPFVCHIYIDTNQHTNSSKVACAMKCIQRICMCTRVLMFVFVFYKMLFSTKFRDTHTFFAIVAFAHSLFVCCFRLLFSVDVTVVVFVWFLFPLSIDCNVSPRTIHSTTLRIVFVCLRERARERE